jgi:hypothetical protein
MNNTPVARDLLKIFDPLPSAGDGPEGKALTRFQPRGGQVHAARLPALDRAG